MSTYLEQRIEVIREKTLLPDELIFIICQYIVIGKCECSKMLFSKEEFQSFNQELIYCNLCYRDMLIISVYFFFLLLLLFFLQHQY